MTSPAVSWLMPLILLPGVALLIMSTSARYGQIHEEIHHIIDNQERISVMYCTHLQKRATLFRNALVSLYVSVGLFVLGSIVGALLDLAAGPDDLVVIGFACIGIICLIYASAVLIQESIFSLRVIEHHLQDIQMEIRKVEDRRKKVEGRR